MTKNKKEVQFASENSVIHFIREHHERFGFDGWTTNEVYQCYREYCSSNGFKTVASNRFGIYGKGYIERKLVRVNGEREYRYFMKEGVSFEEDEDVIIDLDATVDVRI